MRTALTLLCLALAAAFAIGGPAAAKTALFKPWIDGTTASEPTTQTQRYDRDTYVIRQSVKTNFEAPFLYLLFGKDRALLLDTGAGGTPIRPAVEAAIARWLAEHHRASIPLVVAHTHGHGDHHMGDAEFQGRDGATVVGLKPEEVAAFFGITDWPHEVVSFDLGGRTLQVIPTPGHQPAHIMIWDPRTHWLLSGDTLYPGRLYPVSRVMGAHIEMTREPGKDLADEVLVHADEHGLELPYADLMELQAAVHAMGDKAARDVHPDFIVTPTPPR
jgi:glyoxylase-like metal-dependent hydrolase (beta-lactamase superfamily II)